MLTFCVLETSEGPFAASLATWTAFVSDAVHPIIWRSLVTLRAPTFPDIMKLCLPTDSLLLLSVWLP